MVRSRSCDGFGSGPRIAERPALIHVQLCALEAVFSRSNTWNSLSLSQSYLSNSSKSFSVSEAMVIVNRWLLLHQVRGPVPEWSRKAGSEAGIRIIVMPPAYV